jgi:hypothetical protein
VLKKWNHYIEILFLFVQHEKNLIISGTGGHARKVFQTAMLSGWKVTGFVDEDLKGISPIQSYPVFAEISAAIMKYPVFIVAIGDSNQRRRMQKMLISNGGRPATLCHPHAYVAGDAVIKEGSAVLAYAVIESNANVGKGISVDIGALVDHDVQIQDFCHIRTGAIIAPREILMIKKEAE